MLNPEIRIDLHLHSTFSDGLSSPEELCAMACEKGLTHVALCDHDTLAGLSAMREAARRAPRPLCLVEGVELSAGSDGMVHILGYGVPQGNKELDEALLQAEELRRERFTEMLQRLDAMGMSIPDDRLPQGRSGPVGRAHVARALVAMGKVHTVKQAFERYLGQGKPAYVSRGHMSAADAVGLLARVGAVPVLAHPARIGLDDRQAEALVIALKEQGLRGVEVYHPSASRRRIGALEAFARREKLLVTGGSDYHGDQNTSVHVGGLPHGWTQMGQDLRQLETEIARRRAATEQR